MNIVIFGAGAIGSFFGALLSKQSNVILLGRKAHVKAINANGLQIKGLTKEKLKINAVDEVKKIDFKIDLLILSVKSYDTLKAIKDSKPLIDDDTVVLSLQNGLGNIELISKIVKQENILAGTTTNGVIFSKPGTIIHTGYGQTKLGELDGKKTKRIILINKMFNEVGIITNVCNDILKELWIKAIINSSINPLTTIFDCKNGYLRKNPVLNKLVEKICEESTNIAKSNKITLDKNKMINITKDVISKTADNYSSMHQSYFKSKKTEIDSINGRLLDIAKKNNIDCSMNEFLVYCIKSL
jgi:2-dehydropantoate 2-reductase